MYMQNFRGGAKWVPAQVHNKMGPVSYWVRLESWEIMRRHVDYLHKRSAGSQQGDAAVLMDGPSAQEEATQSPLPVETGETEPQEGSPSTTTADSPRSTSGAQSEGNQPDSETPSLRQPSRQRNPSDRLY